MDFLNLDMVHSIQQTQTPLNSLFFSEFNVNLLQKAIRQQFKNETGIAIDYQNTSDLLTIMRAVFVNNSANPYDDVCAQVKHINDVVIKKTLEQINTGVSQYMGYLKDIETPLRPLDIPQNTSTYGNKFGDMNDKIGIQ